MTKLYTNENFPFPVVNELRDMGFDVLTSYEADQANKAIPDEDVLKFATDIGRAVITLNRRDFIKLNRRRTEHEGIIVCTVDPDHSGVAKRIKVALSKHNPMKNKLIRIDKQGHQLESVKG